MSDAVASEPAESPSGPTMPHDVGSSTIKDFCHRHHISLTTYYAMRSRGIGPREIRIGNAIRISSAAETEWVRRMENPTGKQAAEVAANREALRRRAEVAGAAAVLSPEHVVNRRRAEARTVTAKRPVRRRKAVPG